MHLKQKYPKLELPRRDLPVEAKMIQEEVCSDMMNYVITLDYIVTFANDPREPGKFRMFVLEQETNTEYYLGLVAKANTSRRVNNQSFIFCPASPVKELIPSNKIHSYLVKYLQLLLNSQAIILNRTESNYIVWGFVKNA